MVRSALGALAAVLLAGAAPQPAPNGDSEIVLRPLVANGAVEAIEVTLRLPAGVADGFALTAPVVYPGAPGAADRLRDLILADAEGTVPLSSHDDAAVPGGFPYFRHWRAARPVRFPATLRYRALVQPPGGAGGPPFGIRAVGGGLVGSGAPFLVVPEAPSTAPVRVRWNLSGFAPGASATTSFGDGDYTLAGGVRRLAGAWILAGPAQRLPMTQGFAAAWLGTPTFDARTELARAAQGHAYLDRYFPHLKPSPPYRVFMQFRDQPPYGGATALDRSFMFSRGPLQPGEMPRAPLGTIFHEMIHQWVGAIEAPQGESSWFSEGLTSYYEAELPLRGHFESVADYQRHINDYAEQYYTSRARNWSAAAITRVGFGEEEVRHTPYRRSELYFHDLDARIRAASGGWRTLDSLLFPMFVAREKGQRFDTARWEAMVAGELGPEEKGRFERLILAGTDTLEPRADSFGPCFTREATTFAKGEQRIAGYRWVRVPAVPDAACKPG